MDVSRFAESAFGQIRGTPWQAGAGDDPSLVQAAVIQHLLILEARERLHPRFTATALAEAMGDAPRSVQRLVRGDEALSLRDALLVAAISGVDLAALIVATPIEQLPRAVPSLDPTWRRGSWRRPAFSDAPGAPDWGRIAEALGPRFNAEHEERLDSFLVPDVVRHWIARELVRGGAPAGTISFGESVSAVSAQVSLLGPSSVDVEAIAMMSLTESTSQEVKRSTVAATLESLRRGAAAPSDQKIALIAGSPVAYELLTTALAGLADVGVGERLTLAFDAGRSYVEPPPGTVDIELYCIAAADGEGWRIVGFELAKS